MKQENIFSPEKSHADAVREQAKAILEKNGGGVKEAAKSALSASTAGAAITKQGTTRQELETLLNAYKKQITAALPKHITPERLIRVALTAVSRQPKLLECERSTLLGAIVQSSQLGLEPDGILGQAYLVPFWNGKARRMEAQFQIGYKGLIDLARRSGNIVSIVAQAVRTGDVFEYEFGLNEKLRHVPALDGRGEITHFYAYATFTNGGHAFEVMTLEDVELIKARSKSRDKAGNVVGPWETDFEAMGRKTVIRRLSKYLPLSVEMQKALHVDEVASTGSPQNIGVDKISEDGSFELPTIEYATDAEVEEESKTS